MAFVLVRYLGIELGSSERDLEGGEEDESIAMGLVVMGLRRSGGESNDRRGTEVGYFLALMGPKAGEKGP